MKKTTHKQSRLNSARTRRRVAARQRSVGTVKSQTSKAVAQFRQQVGGAASAVAEALRAEAQPAPRQRKGSHAG